jgi:hypothetical protein
MGVTQIEKKGIGDFFITKSSQSPFSYNRQVRRPSYGDIAPRGEGCIENIFAKKKEF